MAKTRHLVAGLLIAAVGAASLTYVGREVPSAPTRRPEPGIVDVAALSPAPAGSQVGELERLIRAFDAQTTASPNASGFAFLGELELERARLTGDVASYARAERALAEAVALAPTDGQAQALLANVRFATHDFSGAYDLASEIYERDGTPAALAVRGDAALELGRYERAAADYRRLAAAAPGSSAALVREARLTFLRGDAAGARRLAARAESAAISEGSFGASVAWFSTVQARLALDAGDVDAAVVHARRAVETAPDYHLALATLASARAAQGRPEAAISLYERAIAIVPDPTTLAAVGDLYAAAGNDRTARDRYATVEAIATLGGTNRQVYDRSLALFRADHGGDLVEALAIARGSLRARRDVYGHDALAWVLYRMGRPDAARRASDRALMLGTPDPRLWFHAGMISAALGDEARARRELGTALAFSPVFDPLLAPIARDTLASFGGRS
jgi:tetratricopeptide (TPR) repeat protein